VLLRGSPLLGIKVSHVALDPLQRSQLAGLPLGRFRTAVVLADERWVDADGDESNGIDGVDQPSVLRQDSLMVMVQVQQGAGALRSRSTCTLAAALSMFFDSATPNIPVLDSEMMPLPSPSALPCQCIGICAIEPPKSCS
jgi:hypothetical protein